MASCGTTWIGISIRSYLVVREESYLYINDQKRSTKYFFLHKAIAMTWLYHVCEPVKQLFKHLELY